MKVKEIGAVVPLSTGGYVVRVQRYASGRKLPEPRTLLNANGTPFASAMKALDALNTWRHSPIEVRKLDARRAPPSPAPVLPTVKTARPIVSDRSDIQRRKAKPIKRVNPEITKLFPDAPTTVKPKRAEGWELADEWLRKGGQVRDCPTGRAAGLYQSRYGGVLPAHLNPVTIEDVTP